MDKLLSSRQQRLLLQRNDLPDRLLPPWASFPLSVSLTTGRDNIYPVTELLSGLN